MQVFIENIGQIKQAKINLNGLSVIAGNNDSGKSTVSKLVFSVIKAFQRYKEDFDYSKEKTLEKVVEELYRNLRYSTHRIDRSDVELNSMLKNDFYPPSFLNELFAFGGVNVFDRKEKIINEFVFEDNLKHELIEKLNEIKEVFFREENDKDLIKKALDNILKSEFENQLNNLSLGKKGTICLKEENSILFNITIENNKVSNIEINDTIIRIKDTTFIDTPIIINLFNYIFNVINYPGRRNKEIQFHLKDLFVKISNSKYEKERQNGFWKKVQGIIGGTFEIVQKQFGDYLIFNKVSENSNNILDPINTATGIKSFGLLDLLDRSHNLDDTNLLILDEPEVHLHPEWQVKYSELIISLINERGLTVLITSHSPYMIEALNKYSKDNNMVNNVNFYLSSKDGNGYVISDKTENINDIFEKLSEPFEKLIWG